MDKGATDYNWLVPAKFLNCLSDLQVNEIPQVELTLLDAHFSAGAPIQLAVAYGDTFKSAHGTFGQFPGEFIASKHVHSYAYHGIVISSSMTNPMATDSGDPKTMGPGSYWYVPANTAHSTVCVSKQPCLFFMHQGTNFDFTPVQ